MTGVARVQAGITLHDLSLALHQRGRALQNLGDIDRQTLAGALSTATHGTGESFGNLSTQMVGGRLVTADGTVRESRTPGPDGPTCSGGPGLAGRSRRTLRGLAADGPGLPAAQAQQPRALADVLAGLDELVAANDHVEFYAVPYSGRALVMTSRRTDEPADPPPAWRTWLTDDLLANRALDLVQRTGRRVPRSQPALGRLTGALLSGSTRLDDSHRVFAAERRVRFTESEWALPRAAAREAVNAVTRLVERHRLPVSFPVEVRFAAADDALLSTAYGRDGVHRGAPVRRVGLAAVLPGRRGGHARPRRPTALGQAARGAGDAARATLPGVVPVRGAAARLDPDGLFVNDHLARTLGRAGGPPDGATDDRGPAGPVRAGGRRAGRAAGRRRPRRAAGQRRPAARPGRCCRCGWPRCRSLRRGAAAGCSRTRGPDPGFRACSPSPLPRRCTSPATG